MYEKLYLIHNPLDGMKDWVSQREFAIGSQRLRNVFGVLYLDDVKIMLQFNAPFKEAVMKENNITDEKQVSLHHVCRMISKAELMDLINKEVQISEKSDSPVPPSYPFSVELKDGYFIWNKEEGCYEADEAISPSEPLQENH